MADKVTIKTNNVPRNLIYGYELTAKERKEFDYYSDEEIDTHNFFRYKGHVYDPNEFMAISGTSMHCIPCENGSFADWHGYHNDSFFSGVLIKYVNDFEQVIVGTFIS